MSIRYYGTTDAGSEDEESEQSLLGARYSTRDCEDEELSQFGSMYSRSVDSMDGDSVLDGSRARIYNKRKRSRSSQILAAGLFLVMALSSIAYTSRAVSFLYRESSGESVQKISLDTTVVVDEVSIPLPIVNWADLVALESDPELNVKLSELVASTAYADLRLSAYPFMMFDGKIVGPGDLVCGQVTVEGLRTTPATASGDIDIGMTGLKKVVDHHRQPVIGSAASTEAIETIETTVAMAPTEAAAKTEVIETTTVAAPTAAPTVTVTNTAVPTVATTAITQSVETTQFWCEYVQYTAVKSGATEPVFPAPLTTDTVGDEMLETETGVERSGRRGRRLDVQATSGTIGHLREPDELALKVIEQASVDVGRDPAVLSYPPLPEFVANVTEDAASQLWYSMNKLTTLHPAADLTGAVGTFGCSKADMSTLHPPSSVTQTSFYFPASPGTYEGWASQLIICSFVSGKAVISIDLENSLAFLETQAADHVPSAAPSPSPAPTKETVLGDIGEVLNPFNWF